jgi:6-phosphogluconolactonase (cycloisomerase 2 family)
MAGGTPTNPHLTQLKVVSTGGLGFGQSSFAEVRQTLAQDGSNECLFVSDGGSSDVAAIIAKTQTLVGNYKGSSGDSGASAGVGVAVQGGFLYASFTGSNTIGTFRIGSGCKLNFVGDVSAQGLNGGFVDGMAAKGSILVAAYVDGSVGSFNISGGVPVSNNDAEFTSGLAAGVDISGNGHYAIFGDAGETTQVEVSNISSGKLTPTVSYSNLGRGSNSNNIWLSPDETILYVSNNVSGQVTALFFNASTGVLSAGCTSPVLRGFDSTWYFAAGIATATTSGTGAVVWVSEDGVGIVTSSIGIVGVTSNGATCTLTEDASSPAADPNSLNLESLSAFPPRPF